MSEFAPDLAALKADRAAVAVVAPVPPLARATVPVTLAAFPLMFPVTLVPASDVIHVGLA